MKIYNNVNKIMNLYKDTTSIDRTPDCISTKKDEVHISQAVKDMSRYIESCLNSDITTDKVDAIRKRIMENTYSIDTRELSRAILDDINGSGDK